MNPYATTKALHHIDRLNILKKGGQPNPVHIHLVLSNLCNHNCKFCAYRQSEYTTSKKFEPDRMIPTPKAIEILENAANMGVRGIQFTGGGEPTVHKDCANIIRIANALGLETALVTNGSRLNEDMENALMKSTWIRISIDAGSAETYIKIRNLKDVSAFWKTIENVESLIDEKGKTGSKLYIGMGFVITKDNWKEIPEAVSLAKQIGVDGIHFAAAYTTELGDYFNDFGDEANKLCLEAEKESTKDFSVLSRFDERLRDLQMGSPDYSRCVYQHLTTFIGADLNVYACCVISYNELGLIGSIKERSFWDLWHSDEKKEFMRTFNAKKCPVCQFNTRNRELNSLLDSLPVDHVNFP